MKKYSKPVFKVFYYIFFIVLLVFLGLLLIQVAEWVPETFGDIPFEQVIFHMLAPVESTDTVNYVQSFIQECLPFPTILTLILVLLFTIQAQFSEKIRLKKTVIVNTVLVICSVISFWTRDSILCNLVSMRMIILTECFILLPFYEDY